jgi:light-regulated signal transduction histidine kinase (bacteriophytochrome)
MQEKKLLQTNKKLESEIEERKITEEKIRLLNLQLIENNEHVAGNESRTDRFAYVASHDLQEPLRKISLFTDKLTRKMNDQLDNEVQGYLQKIVNSSQRMQQLVKDLLNFSRQTNDVLDFQMTNLNE